MTNAANGGCVFGVKESLFKAVPEKVQKWGVEVRCGHSPKRKIIEELSQNDWLATQ